MDPRLKIGLVVGSLLVLLSAPLVLHAFGESGTASFEKALADSQKAGIDFGAGRSDAECMAKGLARSPGCDSDGCTAFRTRFLQGCFKSASVTDAFCADVPHAGEDAKAEAWLQSLCGGRDKAAYDRCIQPYQVKYLHCREPEVDEMLRKRMPEDKRHLWDPLDAGSGVAAPSSGARERGVLTPDAGKGSAEAQLRGDER